MINRALFGIALAATVISFPAAAQRSPSAFAERQMVAAANPFAARAGLAILQRGGSAVDAAIAIQMVLNVVEPQSSGIGGGAFMLHFDSETRKITAFDGRETAPARATPELFLDEAGEPLTFYTAVVGGRAVGVPGTLRLLEEAHRRFGRLPWQDLFGEAIAIAESGFPVSPRLHALIAGDAYLATYPDARRYFFDNTGAALAVGHVLRNPALAETFRRVATQGADSFYEGAIARSIVFAVQAAADNPGLLEITDLSRYEAKVREPVCAYYRRLEVCAMPPPTSGGIATLQILGILQNATLAAEPVWSARATHLFAEANRLAFADRNHYLADPDFVSIPVDRLLDRSYLRQRYKLIRTDTVVPNAEPGTFRHGGLHPPGADTALELPSTSHFSVVDGEGNAVSMTSSIENVFGSRLMVGGFLLNNQLTDFSFRPEADGQPVANRVEGGKRPRSSMSPVIVLDARKRFRMAVGSPGGSRIIGYVAKTLVGIIDWKLDPQTAIDMPNVVNRGRRTELESGAWATAVGPTLEGLGHDIAVVEMTSGLHAIVRGSRGLWGGADSRREGIAIGD